MLECPYCGKLCNSIHGLKKHFTHSHKQSTLSTKKAVWVLRESTYSTKKELLLASLWYSPLHTPFNKKHRVKSREIIKEECEI